MFFFHRTDIIYFDFVLMFSIIYYLMFTTHYQWKAAKNPDFHEYPNEKRTADIQSSCSDRGPNPNPTLTLTLLP